MRITQIISGLYHGGAQKFVVSLSNELFNAGHEVTVISLHGGNEEKEFNKQFLNEGIRYKSFKIEELSMLSILKEVNDYLRSIRSEVIHCHLAVLQYIIPTFLFSKVKVFHTLHSLAQYADGGGGWHANLYKLLYKTKKVIPVTISDECHQSFIDYYHLTCDVTIPNGCEQAKTSTNIESVRQEVQTYKSTQNTKVFIHVARFHEAKNQHLLIDSFNELFYKGVDFTLMVLGSGFDSQDAVELTNKACDRIHFIGAKNNVGDYLACSDAFCLSSIYEGLPISLLEAMSMNVVPICTPVGGILNVIEDGKNGFLSKDLSKNAYVATLMRYIETYKGGFPLYEIYKAHYSMELCANKYVNLFKQKK